MASKRQRGESSRSTPPYDKKRFVSFIASQRYHQFLLTKNLIPERGLLPSETDGDIATMISTRRWQTFTNQPEAAAVNVVKEFYANAKEAKEDSVFVRGKWINMGKTAINAYYGLQDIHDSGYEAYLRSEVNYNEIISSICEPGTEWKVTASQEVINFSLSKLSKYGKAWYGFVCAKLMPTRHKTDVTKERAALLYCIVMDKSIDVGALIHDSILKTLDASTSGGLPHPSLISALCLQAGVQWDKEEVLQAPFAPLDHSVISRFKVWSGGVSHPRGIGYIISVDVPAAEASDQPEIPILPADPIEELRRDSRHHTRRIDLVARRVEYAIQRNDRQNHRLAKRQAEMYNYNIHCNRALQEMFAAMNPNAASVQFPTPPVLSRYPPSDLESDEDDEEDDDSADDQTNSNE